MAQAQLPQLFGVIPTGAPCITVPTSAPTEISFLFTLPTTPRPFSHICVFLLPGITLPPNTAAAVYISMPQPSGNGPQFKFLGGIGPGKESAIFKVSGLAGNSSINGGVGGVNGEVDMDAPENGTGNSSGGVGEVTLGISLESAESVSLQMAALQSSQSATSPNSNSNSNSQALVLSGRGGGVGAGEKKVDTVVLAQRIIKNAFNFLASFSGNVGGSGVEVVPLKAFEEWWRKFEGRVRSDPGFLERDGD